MLHPETERTEREKAQGGPYHLTLLAENATGYQNLLKLVSIRIHRGVLQQTSH